MMSQERQTWRWLQALFMFGLCTLQAASQRIAPCSDGMTSGYTNITALNMDIADEFARIEAGGMPQPPYLYPLCPDTVFDMSSGPLLPLLSELTVTCGPSGDGMGCRLSGGTRQVLFADSALDGYEVETVMFQGLTFMNFSETSIAAYASANTTATFMSCAWTNFASEFVINQTHFQTVGSTRSMGIQIADSTITNGAGGVALSNANGDLQISGLSMSNVSLVSMIAAGNGGTTVVTDFNVTQSSAPAIIFADAGSSMTVSNAEIRDNVDIVDVFFSDGQGTSMILSDILVAGNNIATGWNVAFISASSRATIANAVIVNNTNLETGISSSESGMVVVNSTEFRSNVGTAPNVSAIAFAISDSTIALGGVSILDNTQYTASVFAIFRSSLGVVDTCIIGGDSSTVIFVGDESTATVDASRNYIADHTSSACNGPNNRLFQEDAGSMCFQGGECTGTCQEAASSTSCPNGDTAAPSMAPIGEATVAPVSTAPVGMTTGAPVPATDTSAPVMASVAPVVAETQAPIDNAATPQPVVLFTPMPTPSATTPATPVPTPAPQGIMPFTMPPVPTRTQRPGRPTPYPVLVGKGTGKGKGKGKKGKGKGKKEKGKGKKEKGKGKKEKSKSKKEKGKGKKGQPSHGYYYGHKNGYAHKNGGGRQEESRTEPPQEPQESYADPQEAQAEPDQQTRAPPILRYPGFRTIGVGHRR